MISQLDSFETWYHLLKKSLTVQQVVVSLSPVGFTFYHSVLTITLSSARMEKKIKRKALVIIYCEKKQKRQIMHMCMCKVCSCISTFTELLILPWRDVGF